MSLDQFLDLFFRSNVLIIEILFGVILGGVVFLTYYSFSKPENLTGNVNLQGLEDGIKKILDNYSNKDSSVSKNANTPLTSSPEGEGGIMEEMATQIERLKLKLMQKSEEVEQLKSQVSSTTLDPAQFQEAGSAIPAPAATVGGSGAGTAALEEKIKGLEARLAEYSIIENDIADLSYYKEETVKLQGEVDRLKAKLAEYEAGGAPTKATAPAESKSAEVVAAAPPPPETTPEPKSEKEAAPQVQSSPEASAAADDSSSVDDDIMAEFERAVAEQKAMTAAQNAATSVPPPPVEEPKSEESQATIGEAEESSEAAPEGGINLDKMLSEVGALPEAGAEDAMNALEQALDTEKLLEEATGMEKIDTEALNDFDEFLKKEGA